MTGFDYAIRKPKDSSCTQRGVHRWVDGTEFRWSNSTTALAPQAA